LLPEEALISGGKYLVLSALTPGRDLFGNPHKIEEFNEKW